MCPYAGKNSIDFWHLSTIYKKAFNEQNKIY